MEDIFIKILNMSITASYFAIALILIRTIFKKIPKWIYCVLWGLVGLRLVLPFSFESVLSLIPSTETIPNDIMLSKEPHITSGIPALNYTINPIISQSLSPEPYESANPLQSIFFILSIVWLIGIVIMLIYAVVSYALIKRKTIASIEESKGIFICDNIDTPFILGVIKPKIYVPSFVGEEDKLLILAHENAHKKRLDHIWKPLAYIILTVYWFNPLMWLVFILLCRDIESACDEKVIKEMGTENKKAYSKALINCSAPKKYITVCPLAFGETGVKNRIKNILNYKRPAFWILIAAAALSLFLSVLFMTDPTAARINDTSVGKQLTLDDVLSFSEKGDELSWEDFEDFAYTETGSGLYIRIYKLDERFSLSIGGILEEKPMYIYLSVPFEGEQKNIDIRTGNVEAFIEDNKNNPLPEEDIHYAMHYCPVDSTGDNLKNMVSYGSSIPKLWENKTKNSATVQIDTSAELDDFYEFFSDKMNFDMLYDDTEFSFTRLKEVYKSGYDGFFEEHSLLITYFSTSNIYNRFQIIRLYSDSGTLYCSIREKVRTDISETTPTGWFIVTEVQKEQIKNIKTVNAFIEETLYLPEEQITEDPIRVYVFRDSYDELLKPNFSLYEDGSFVFNFSPFSSYLCIGTYTQTENTLTLTTKDGLYTYTFIKQDDTMIFDAKNSSDKLWYSDIKDKSVFY